MEYLHWDAKTVADLSPENVSRMYDAGYVFTRIGKGVMHQTRSVRIDLSKFELVSENRRVLKKMAGIDLASKSIPLSDYSWELGKTAKDFYDMKFGPGIMSAAKVKEMLTDEEKSNFNRLLEYTYPQDIPSSGTRSGLLAGRSFSASSASESPSKETSCGYVICYQNNSILHYSYPFYHIDMSPKDMGLGMMTMAIQNAKDSGLRYVYLGSLQRPTDTYKLQFSGLEWFDGAKWSDDLEEAKKILKP